MRHSYRQSLFAISLLAVLLSSSACDTRDPPARSAADASQSAGAGAAPQRKEPAVDPSVAADRNAQAETQATASRIEGSVEDAAIWAKVTTGLAADRTLTAARIEVASRDGMVTLKGVVATAAAKGRASEIARNVMGVTWVDNQLRLQPG